MYIYICKKKKPGDIQGLITNGTERKEQDRSRKRVLNMKIVSASISQCIWDKADH